MRCFQFLVLCSTSTVRPSATAWNCIVKCTAKKVGILKISCRTQSQTLLNAIQQFFLFWVQLEQAYEGIEIQELYQIESNRLTRRLRRHGISSNEALGTAVGKYIQLFHTVLQSYFQGLQQGVPAAILRHALEKQYVALHEKLLPKP